MHLSYLLKSVYTVRSFFFFFACNNSAFVIVGRLVIACALTIFPLLPLSVLCSLLCDCEAAFKW